MVRNRVCVRDAYLLGVLGLCFRVWGGGGTGRRGVGSGDAWMVWGVFFGKGIGVRGTGWNCDGGMMGNVLFGESGCGCEAFGGV